jgi:hypothetical protein
MTYTHTTKQKTARATNSSGLHINLTGTDFRTDGANHQAGHGKAIATQLVRLALAGHIVHKGSAGDYTVCKYGMTRYCKDFAELQAFSRKLGVTQ